MEEHNFYWLLNKLAAKANINILETYLIDNLLIKILVLILKQRWLKNSV